MHYININQYINFYNLFFIVLITALFYFKQGRTENIDHETGKSNDKVLEESEGKHFIFFLFAANILTPIVSCLMHYCMFSVLEAR